MKIIEFDGDPMLQLEKFPELDSLIFYLNQESLDEISSYCTELKENIPPFFADKDSSSILFAEGGVDEEGKEFPDTYIGVKSTSDATKPYKISGIFASDLQYGCPETGEEILLKKNDRKLEKD